MNKPPHSDPKPSGYVGLVPYELRPKGALSALKLADLDWPLGAPLTGTTVGDLTANDHILVHPNTSLHVRRWGSLKAKVSLLIAEPDSIHRKHLTLLRFSHRRFHRILTRSPIALNRFKNARLFVTGATFLEHSDRTAPAKTVNASLIASGKTDHEGHRLRHALVDKIRAVQSDVQVMGRGYAPFDRKEDGLAPFRYSVVIENTQEPSYFTEKIIDCCLCHTIPIYWGAPDIKRWFAPEGVMICNTLEDLQDALAQADASDYETRHAAILQNYDLALTYAQTGMRAAHLLLNDRAETPPFP
ncbi:MAG: hypothetical protein ABJL99_09710 [Aliishimia sp.]